MFQDVLLVELFQRTLPNPLLFSSNSAQKVSRQNLPVLKKAISFFPVLLIPMYYDARKQNNLTQEDKFNISKGSCSILFINEQSKYSITTLKKINEQKML